MSPYAILGIPENSQIEVVKTAYRKLAKQYHPDLNPDDAGAESRFHEIQSAYDQITSPAPAQQSPRFHFTTVLETMIEVTIEEAFHGAKKSLTIRTPFGDSVELLVDVPVNTLHGTRLKVTGLPQSLNTVDLYIIVVISEAGPLRVMNTTIVARLTIDFVTAILGGEKSVMTLDGERYFTVDAGTQPGAMVKLSGLGFRIPNAPNGQRDDFVVILDISLPQTISENQKAALEAFRDAA